MTYSINDLENIVIPSVPVLEGSPDLDRMNELVDGEPRELGFRPLIFLSGQDRLHSIASLSLAAWTEMSEYERALYSLFETYMGSAAIEHHRAIQESILNIYRRSLEDADFSMSPSEKVVFDRVYEALFAQATVISGNFRSLLNHVLPGEPMSCRFDSAQGIYIAEWQDPLPVNAGKTGRLEVSNSKLPDQSTGLHHWNLAGEILEGMVGRVRTYTHQAETRGVYAYPLYPNALRRTAVILSAPVSEEVD